ncbi:hypothetical protein N7448_008621 [Penicillium atrosanguineum]|nr:hypothetical protein N7448_008621 [Penicillium atrosanguineum]KAJ5148049.1 hypothetical protein N7526_001401 [Penicillium atrosanguineum]
MQSPGSITRQTQLYSFFSYVESLGSGPRNHQSTYIETQPTIAPNSVKGVLHHVTGRILNGMSFDIRDTPTQNIYSSTSWHKEKKPRPSITDANERMVSQASRDRELK